MKRIGVALVHLLRLVMWLAFPAGVYGQNDEAEARKAFFDTWRQAILAGDEAKAKQLARANPEIGQRVAGELGLQARSAFETNNKELAKVYFMVTQQLFEHLGDNDGIAIASSDLGMYYVSAGECPTALQHLVRASDLFRKLDQLDRRAKAADAIQQCVLKEAFADPSLNANTNLKVSPKGEQVIVYNRKWCQQAGINVCGFYLVHEYAHIFLKHATNRVASERSEPEADCWAAKHVSIEWGKAAYTWFIDGAASPEVHVRSDARAEAIKRCAGF